MRSKTQKIFERLVKGGFIMVDSSDTKELYLEIDENLEEYTTYFEEIGFRIESGDGYFYFSRIGEGKQTIEQKLRSFGKWVDYLDYLKAYDSTFSVGYQFRKASILEHISVDVELRDKTKRLFSKEKNNEDSVQVLIDDLKDMNFIECVNETDETYKVTSAIRYAEDLVNMLTIYNEDEIPE